MMMAAAQITTAVITVVVTNRDRWLWAPVVAGVLVLALEEPPVSCGRLTWCIGESYADQGTPGP